MEERSSVEKNDAEVFECEAEPVGRGAAPRPPSKTVRVSWVALILVAIVAIAVFKLAAAIVLIPLMFLLRRPGLVLTGLASLMSWKWWSEKQPGKDNPPRRRS